jgi:hypothetical protein
MAAYEQSVFDWHFAREEVPVHDGWHWARRLATAGLSFLLVAALAKARIHSERIGGGALVLAWSVTLLSVAGEALLGISPAAFARVGAEDSAIEWLSALLLFGAAGFMALRLQTVLRLTPAHGPRWIPVVIAAGFTALFALMALEEVSWFQRQIGFDTPEAVAARNWQGEFNLHNFHTDITELALYSGTGIFLMLLPLLRGSEVARWPLVRVLAPFLPDRTVAAVSAPMLVFTYSHWTLLPVQAAFWIGLGVCIAFARSSITRHGTVLWSTLAVWVAAGQLFMLAFGHTMVMIFDSSEYRELFISIGLAAYAFRQSRARDA